MLTVAELASDPSLQLRVVAGHAGSDRTVEAAAVSELTEPGPWLQGGELLLTIGLLLDDSDAEFQAYVAGLDRAGVRALGLGLGRRLRFQAAPTGLAAAADAAGMPLLCVPEGVPFIAVTKAVFAHRAREERRRLEWALDAQRALTAAAVHPGGLAGILAAHAEATGRTGLVVDLLGRPVAESGPGAARLAGDLSAVLDAVREQGLRASAVDSTADRRREVLPLGSRRLRAWLLLDGPAAAPHPHQVTGNLVSLVTLELERRQGLGAAQRRGRAQVLAKLSQAAVDDLVAARWLASIGLSDGDLRAAVIEAPGVGEDVVADLSASLPDALARVAGELVELAVPTAVDLPAVLATLVAGRPAGIGIGVRPGAFVVSRRQALSALPESRITGRHTRAGELESTRMLLSGVPAERLAAHADAVLGYLDASGRAGELTRALTVFLENNGHWEAAATTLGVHRHTVRARIEAVERLTGRRLGSAQDRHELWLALRARDLARMTVEE